jgi:hypothetical protein
MRLLNSAVQRAQFEPCAAGLDEPNAVTSRLNPLKAKDKGYAGAGSAWTAVRSMFAATN